MRTYVLAAVAVALAAGPAAALRVAVRPVPQRAVTAEVVVVGKVTALEKEVVEALPPYAGAKEKTGYRVAVVKIDSALSGATNLTHIKVGVPVPVAPPPGARPGRPIRGPRGPLPALELKEGQEWLLFLVKHPAADFYVIPNMSAPVDASTDAGKQDVETVKQITALLADPMKGLKSDKADVRARTAALVVMKYRAYPEGGGEVDQVAVGADESKLILKGLAGADWGNTPRAGADVGHPVSAFYQLGLTEQDGWKPPAFPRPAPGQPPVDFNALVKDAFVKWLDGPGKDYRVKKVVAKKAEK